MQDLRLHGQLFVGSLQGPECGNDIHLLAGQQSHSLSYVTAHLFNKYFMSSSRRVPST